MKRITIIFLTLTLCSCGKIERNETTSKAASQEMDSSIVKDTIAVANELTVNDFEYVIEDTCTEHWTSSYNNYQDLRDFTHALRTKLYKRYLALRGQEQHLFLDSVGMVYGKLIAKEYLPHWCGTTWDFNGHTDVPKEDAVACGYLVSTILKHSGINLNRFTMAQQAASYGAMTLLGGENTPPLTSIDNMPAKVESLQDGLYKVGLNNHTGFLWIENTIPYFLHSSFIHEEGVVAEKAMCSLPFIASTIFQIVPISSNRFIIKKWLSGEAVHVYTR